MKEQKDELGRNEKTRIYLNRLKTIDKRIKMKLEEAERWREIAENHSPHLSDIKVQSSPKPDKMAEAVANALQYEQESYDLANDLVKQKKVMVDQIYDMDERYCTILNLFFMQNKRYKEIESELDITFNNVRCTLRKSIIAFGEKYSKEIDEYIDTKL